MAAPWATQWLARSTGSSARADEPPPSVGPDAGQSPRSSADQVPRGKPSEDAPQRKAQVAITLDLEMSRNFPRWEDTHWDYEKGLLDEPTKRHSLEAARRVARRGHKIHFFAVGRVFEQPNIEWLQQIVRLGHPVGNHTYDHVNVLATRVEDLQFRFQRAPWLVGDRRPAQVIADNIRLCTVAMQKRLDYAPHGFRTPGGFHSGLAEREDIQKLLMAQGFDWVSSKYPAHPMTRPEEAPTETIYQGIVDAQLAAQPSVYPTGLIEVPMSPVSDINAFRTGRWKLSYFLEAIRRAVAWTIQQGAVFDFLCHPSCLVNTDPKFAAIDLICDLVEAAGPRAEIVDLDTIARRVSPQSGTS
jgi:hypothetical protein